jgi:hypothetical protein
MVAIRWANFRSIERRNPPKPIFGGPNWGPERVRKENLDDLFDTSIIDEADLEEFDGPTIGDLIAERLEIVVAELSKVSVENDQIEGRT